MPLPEQTHSDSPSPVPSISLLRRENLPNSMGINTYADVPSIVTSADDSFPFETDWCTDADSDSDSDSERDFSCFGTDLFENRLFTDHLNPLGDHDRELDSVPGQFTNSANELGILGFEDNGEIESNYILDLWSTFSLVSDSRVSEVDVSMQGSDSINNGVHVVDVDSDSDSDSDNGIISALLSGENDVNWEESPNPLLDNFSFCIQQRISYDDFEWEEVEDQVDEREISNVVVDGAEELSLASGLSNDEGSGEAGEEASRWEILLVMDDAERNTNWEEDNYAEDYTAEQDDNMYAAVYDALFEQFDENEFTLKGSPPAAKSAVENLPLVELKEENILTEEVCTVCTDKFSMEEKVRKLPCCHYYHDDCIVPWLNIRNTCPVCRYEFPTDDPDYERQKTRRASDGLQTDLQVRYNFELIA